MKALCKLLVPIFVLIISSVPALALNVTFEVHKEEARKMGVVVTSQNKGDSGIWMKMEFPAKKEFQGFARVDLIVKSGDKDLVAASLGVTRPTADTLSTGFRIHPSMVKDSILSIVVNSKGGMIYRFKLKDFVEADKISIQSPRKD